MKTADTVTAVPVSCLSWPDSLQEALVLLCEALERITVHPAGRANEWHDGLSPSTWLCFLHLYPGLKTHIDVYVCVCIYTYVHVMCIFSMCVCIYMDAYIWMNFILSMFFWQSWTSEITFYIWKCQKRGIIYNFLHMQWKGEIAVCVIWDFTYLKSENTLYTIAFNTANNIVCKIDSSRNSCCCIFSQQLNDWCSRSMSS